MKCELCGDEWPDHEPNGFVKHFDINHPDIDTTTETWPDGSPVIYDDTLEPEDFNDPT